MTLRLNGSTSGYTEIDAPAVAGSNTLVLPTGNGTSGQVLTTNGSGALSWVDISGPKFRAYKSGSSTTTITTNTWTKIILDAESFDTASCFDSTTNYRFTPNKAGYYLILGQVATNWSGSQYTQAIVAIYFNGAISARYARNVSGTDYGQIAVKDLIYFNGTTDYAELYCTNNGGTPTYDQGSTHTFFAGTWISA
jgi:hypothetical protein